MRWQLPTIFLLALFSALPAAATAPYLVADINPYFHSGDSGPVHFIALGDVGLFMARDAEAGYELWRSDGTAAGTYLLADHCEGAAGRREMIRPGVGVRGQRWGEHAPCAAGRPDGLRRQRRPSWHRALDHRWLARRHSPAPRHLPGCLLDD